MAAFETVFDDETRNRLVGALVLVCGDRSVAEELAQEALATGWAHWPRISRFRSPRAWVWRCAFNAAASAGRRKGAEARALTRAYERSDHDPDPTSSIALWRCIEQLSQRQREAIVCRYYSDLSVRETAKVLGCREGTVKALTSQAIDRLRSMDLIEGQRAHGATAGGLKRDYHPRQNFSEASSGAESVIVEPLEIPYPRNTAYSSEIGAPRHA